MKYQQYPVHPALRKWVRYFWSYDLFAEQLYTLHIKSFADQYPRLIIQDLKSSSLIKECNGSVKPYCYLSGIDTFPTETSWESRFSHFGVSFFPHALSALFGVDAVDLTNQTPDLADLGWKELAKLLCDAGAHLERVSILEQFFYTQLQRLKQDTIIEDLFNKSVKLELDEPINLLQQAKYYNISGRQLQRRFKRCVGVSAKKFGRITRFQHALELIPKLNYGDLTAGAYGLGYADQAHFIHDFKLFSGFSPLVFLKSAAIGSESASFIYLA
jgi:AraC-like DNA-binding protein